MFILAPHLIDIIVALLGRPDRVTSFSQNLDNTFPWAQDNTAAVFEYPGTMATIESAAAEVSSGQSRRLEVYGTRGSAILEPLDPPSLRLCLDEDRDGYAEGWQNVEIEKRPSQHRRSPGTCGRHSRREITRPIARPRIYRSGNYPARRRDALGLWRLNT